MASKGRISVATKKQKTNTLQAKPKAAAIIAERESEEEESASERETESEEEESDDGSDEEEEDSDLDDEAEIDDEDLDDEMDLDNVSSDDEIPKKKKGNKNDDGSESFANAMSAILGSHLKAYDRKDPIMARNKKVLKKDDSDKLEAKARKAIAMEKKKLLQKSRKTDIIPMAEGGEGELVRDILEKERRLRKVAQKGVVKLFNAILSTQVKTSVEITEKLGDVKNKKEREELISEVSKEKFLDLVKAAGDV